MLCLVFLFTNSSNSQELVPGQIYQTGNIVVPTTTSSGSTWTGAVYQDSLTCWGQPGDTGYCGPQAIVRPGGSLNFSYGSTYVYQQQHINTILPAITGLQVNGYNFGFTAKNGNGWDDGRTDSLTALVRFWDSTGSKGANNLLYGNAWSLNSKFNWTTFNYSDTFQTPLAATNVGLVQYGFIGRDNNGWAGPYGPELYGVNFSVKYSVDPCSSNPLYSPTCKGYLDALAKLMPAPIAAPIQEIAAVAPQTSPEQNTVTPTTATAAPQATAVSSTVSTVPVAVVSTSANTQEKSSSSPANLSFALNLIAKNSDREKATQQAAVSSAIAEAQAAATKNEQETSQTVAALGSMSAQSVEVGVALATSGQQSAQSAQSSSSTKTAQSQFTGQGIQLIQPANTQPVITAQQLSEAYQPPQQTMLVAVAPTNYQLFQSPQPQLLQSAAPETVQVAAAQTTFAQSERQQADPEAPQVFANFLLDRTNPLREILDSSPILLSDFIEQRQDNRNKVVQPNELAAGVDLTKIALVPQNYASYTNFTLRDANFYEPKEVYKNQTVVDNVRVLRGLGSDQKHQDLVNLQYK